jgi:endonuclease/exonuclease/phosphatase family metal-dependent hydrolase
VHSGLVAFLLFAAPAWAAVRVASLNIAKESGPALIEKMRTQPDLRKADIILLQEVVDFEGGHVAREAGKALGMQVEFRPAFDLRPGVKEGLAILSKFPLSDPVVLQLERNRLHFKNRIRIALAVTARTPLGPVRVIDVHLDNRINSDRKRSQMAGLWPEVDQASMPVILGGDFNSGNFYWVSHVVPIPEADHQRTAVVEEMRKHGFTTTMGHAGATYHIPFQVIDWIFVKGLTAGESGITPIGFSDHNSVWLEVR